MKTTTKPHEDGFKMSVEEAVRKLKSNEKIDLPVIKYINPKIHRGRDKLKREISVLREAANRVIGAIPSTSINNAAVVSLSDVAAAERALKALEAAESAGEARGMKVPAIYRSTTDPSSSATVSLSSRIRTVKTAIEQDVKEAEEIKAASKCRLASRKR